MSNYGMPKKVRARDSLCPDPTEAIQYVRYEAGHTNWDTIHSWTGGLIHYVGHGTSEVKSHGGKTAVRTIVRPGDGQWIVRTGPRRYAVLSAEEFDALYVEAASG